MGEKIRFRGGVTGVAGRVAGLRDAGCGLRAAGCGAARGVLCLLTHERLLISQEVRRVTRGQWPDLKKDPTNKG